MSPAARCRAPAVPRYLPLSPIYQETNPLLMGCGTCWALLHYELVVLWVQKIHSASNLEIMVI